MPSSETSIIGSPDTKLPLSRLRSNGSFPKKTREQHNEPLFDIADDARPKTRRVNPERLATRLDPTLVAEMEALIVPGAKMPNFAIRKDFQERYCVDRRHIYDYFHSRGLRVAKEDKHNNLLKGRLLKARSLMAIPTDDVTGGPIGKTTLKRPIEVAEKPKRAQSHKAIAAQKVETHKYHVLNGSPDPSSTSSIATGISSRSPALGDSEEASPNPSSESDVTMALEVTDSISICAYTESDIANSSFDSLYSYYDVAPPMSTSTFGYPGMLALGEERAPFLQEELLGYYDVAKSFFAPDGTFQDAIYPGRDKIPSYHVKAKNSFPTPAQEAHQCLETKPSLKPLNAELLGAPTRDEGDVDFSKWLLVEVQDDKDGPIMGCMAGLGSTGQPRLREPESQYYLGGVPALTG